MKRRALIAICSLLLVQALPAAAQVLASAAPATAAASTLTRDELLASLSRQLAERFQLRGDLQLELQRQWVAPTSSAGTIEAVVLEFPARLASTILLRVRLQSANRSLGEQMIPLHVQLHRDVYAVRVPLARDAAFDASLLDVRRVDEGRSRLLG